MAAVPACVVFLLYVIMSRYYCDVVILVRDHYNWRVRCCALYKEAVILPDFLNTVIYNNTIQTYLIFLGALIVSFIVIKIIGGIILRHAAKLAQKTKTTIDDLLCKSIRRYVMPGLYFTAFYLNTKILVIGKDLQSIIDMVILAIVTVCVALFASSVTVMLFNKYWEGKRSNANKELAIKTMSGLLKIGIWSIAIILFLDNVGFEINTLIAGVGIGGIAIAFAAQAILGDIFCFFTIFFDRPFEIGDFIIAGQQMGTVEYIGLKTTRLRSLGGEQLIFSNSDLTSSRIQNYKRMEQRRVLFTLGVTYETPSDKLEMIPSLIKDVITCVDLAQFDRCHFASFGDFSLNVETVYYVLSSDYYMYMDIHQKVNLSIKRVFEEQGIDFAYPTQTVLVSGDEPSSARLG